MISDTNWMYYEIIIKPFEYFKKVVHKVVQYCTIFYAWKQGPCQHFELRGAKSFFNLIRVDSYIKLGQSFEIFFSKCP